MNDAGLFWTLALGAATVGALHTLAPDHWLPFAAVARARGWSTARTLRVTLLCGLGHVTVSVLLGLLAVFFGLELFQSLGARLEAVAGLLLVGFGVVYCAFGLWRAAAHRLHGHAADHAWDHDHPAGDGPVTVGDAHAHLHVHRPERLTAWGLFVFFSADPCVAVIPVLVAAARLGAARTAAVALAYEAATIGTMAALVLAARAGTARLWRRLPSRFVDAAAGSLIAVVGLAMILLDR